MTQSTDAENFLQHYGVLGMKWGKRKGPRHPASDDALRAVEARMKAKNSGLQSLSNKEIQDLVSRMKLEQQYKQLNPPKYAKARKAIKDFLIKEGQKQVADYMKTQGFKEVQKAFVGGGGRHRK